LLRFARNDSLWQPNFVLGVIFLGVRFGENSTSFDGIQNGDYIGRIGAVWDAELRLCCASAFCGLV
jgi:hypothetical protein